MTDFAVVPVRSGIGQWVNHMVDAMSRKPRWGYGDLMILFVWLATIFYFVTDTYLPRLEGQLAPVVVQSTVTDPVSVDDGTGNYVWTLTFEKVRDCEFIPPNRIEWHYVTPSGRRQSVLSRFAEPVFLDVEGDSLMTKMVIGLDPESMEKFAYATVRHQCANRWWETETVFYPPT